MNEELEELQIIAVRSDLPNETKDDLKTFFSGLESSEISDLLHLCRKDEKNLDLISRLIQMRKEALIQNDSAGWEDVLAFEQGLLEKELREIQKDENKESI